MFRASVSARGAASPSVGKVSERTPHTFDQVVADRPPIAPVKRVHAIAKQENFRRRKCAAPNPSLRCASVSLNRRNLDSIDAEHAAIAAHALAPHCGQAFDEAAPALDATGHTLCWVTARPDAPDGRDTEITCANGNIPTLEQPQAVTHDTYADAAPQVALAAADTAHLTDALRTLMRRVSPPGLIEQVFVVERRADGVLETRVVSAAQPPVSVPAATPGWPAWRRPWRSSRTKPCRRIWRRSNPANPRARPAPSPTI